MYFATITDFSNPWFLCLWVSVRN